MLTVITPEEAQALLRRRFPPCPAPETVPLEAAPGRVLYAPVEAEEFVPDFDRSTVDGYAVRCADTFGCSDAIPALLTLAGEVAQGQAPPAPLEPGQCMAIATGGALPAGGDGVVMVEYTQDFGGGLIAVCRPAAPGENLIFRGDDARPGQTVLPAGVRLTPAHVGALAALGHTKIQVCRPPVVGILSTGDEIVPVSAAPGPGQVRDVNAPLLRAICKEAGGQGVEYGVLPDDEQALAQALERALEECDMVLISGGSSVGAKDATCRVLEAHGELLFHGVAMKPGKPTLAADVAGKPVFGLPGHPAAAFFTARLFVRPLIARRMGRTLVPRAIRAVLTQPVSANHGRAQYTGVTLEMREGTWYAAPIRGKSGLITALAGAEGCLAIPRDCEGLAAGTAVDVLLYSLD